MARPLSRGHLAAAHVLSTLLPASFGSKRRFRKLLFELADAKRTDIMRQVFEIFTTQQSSKVALATLEQKHFTFAIASFGKAKCWQDAIGLLHSMPRAKFDPTIYSYNASISACQGALWPWALQLFQELQLHDLQPDSFSFNSTMSALEKSEWQKTLHIFEKLEESGLSPDVFSFSTLISSFGATALWPKSIHCLELMHKKKVRPNIYSYSAAIASCQRGYQWSKALHLLQKISRDSDPLK